MLGFYGNKHSGYAVNPMAPEHQLPFPDSLPYHLEVIDYLFIQKLTKDRSAFILHKILLQLIPILALIHCLWFCSHGNTQHPVPFDIYPMYSY